MTERGRERFGREEEKTTGDRGSDYSLAVPNQGTPGSRQGRILPRTFGDSASRRHLAVGRPASTAVTESVSVVASPSVCSN